jgi:hypothetical protein
MTDGPKLHRDLSLVERTVPMCPMNVDVPWPVDERLLRLVDLVHDESLGPTSKRELAAALIYAAPASGLEMWDRIVTYRRASVGDAAFWVPGDSDPTIAFAERKSGRRPRS